MGKKCKSDTNHGGVLGAMMPGATIGNKGKIILNVSTSKETVVFNVGGTKFETYCWTLRAQPNSRLADEKFLKSHFRDDHGDYFFDKDPDIFRVVLNYLRTGHLHLPSYICGPAIKDELEYWGLSCQLIERCCWNNYNSWNSTLEALNQLEMDRKGFLHEDLNKTRKSQTNDGKRIRPRLWEILNNPSSSTGSKIFGVISMMFVFVSIVSFLAGTHETFIYFVKAPINNNGSSLTLKNETVGDDVLYTATIENQTEKRSILLPSLADYSEVRAKHPALEIIDIICLVFFTIEYIARLVTAPRKLSLAISLMGVIDLAAILHGFIEMIVYAVRPSIYNDETALNVIQVFQIIRILRIFRLIRHIPGLWIMVYTLKSSFGELVLLVVLMMVGMLIFASLIYFVEDKTVFTSVPRGFWWALITMTTVGYGDMYPVTALGYLIGSFAALSGLLMIGFSVPILVNNFVMYYTYVQFALHEENKENKNKKLENGTELIDKTEVQDCRGFKLLMMGNNETDNNDNTDFGTTSNAENDLIQTEND